MEYKQDAQGYLVDPKNESDKLTDKEGNFLKLDGENIVNEKGQKVDTNGNIIPEKKPEAGKFRLEEYPEELRVHLPKTFNDLSQEEQNKALVKMANKAKSADDKETFIKKQADEIGKLRPVVDEYNKFKDTLDKKPTKSELESFIEGLKDKYDQKDLEDIQKIAALQAEEKSKPIKNLLGIILEENLKNTIQSDPDIDADIYKENEKEIMSEYHRYRDAQTPQEMRENLKDAALKVQKKIVSGMSDEGKKTYEAKRNARIGAIPGLAEKGRTRDTRTEMEKIGDNIVDAGKKKGEGVFG